jgi:hypothetical protein
MTNSLTEIMSKLEQQKGAIERALSALRDVDGSSMVSEVPVASKPAAKTRAKRKGGMTAEGRKRLSEALKQRWAAKRASAAAATVKKRGRRKAAAAA